jgi:hypothetical protein
MFFGGNLSHVINDFSDDVRYDSFGRTITQPVNVNGNYNAYAYFNSTFPIQILKTKLSPNIDGGVNNRINLVNGIQQYTREYSAGAGLDFSIELDKFYFSGGGNFSYNDPESSISEQSNQPYHSQNYFVDIYFEFPKKFIFSTDARYIINSRRANGYNLNYVIWNASVSKKFFKNDNLELSIEANDLLNQNINTSRTVTSNSIIDSKANVIQRYILFRAIWRFKDKKTKRDELEE